MRVLWPGSIEVLNIGSQDSLELLLLQDEQVIETLATHTQEKAFTDRIGSWCMIRRFQDLDATRLGNPREAHTKFALIIPDEVFRTYAKGDGLPKRYVRSTRQWESV